jgi:hypothetical protein
MLFLALPWYSVIGREGRGSRSRSNKAEHLLSWCGYHIRILVYFCVLEAGTNRCRKMSRTLNFWGAPCIMLCMDACVPTYGRDDGSCLISLLMVCSWCLDNWFVCSFDCRGLRCDNILLRALPLCQGRCSLILHHRIRTPRADCCQSMSTFNQPLKWTHGSSLSWLGESNFPLRVQHIFKILMKP